MRLEGRRNSSVPRPKALNCLRCSIRCFIHHSSECGLLLLRFHVDGFVVIFGIDGDGQIQFLRIGARKAGVAVRAPLHGRADAVAVAEINVVAHADFIAVINHRRAGQREQQRVHQLDLAAVVFEQRRQTAANPQVDAHAPVAARTRGTCSRAPRR